MRVIDGNGEQRGIMPTAQALELANEAGLQLVEVNPKANPPVCKVMDYGKFKYESAKREREAKKNQKTFELKEVKFRPKTHGHDFDFKLRHVRRFLEDGDKVKLVVQFRGREVTHPETGRDILDRVVKGVVDLATVMQIAQMEQNRMSMVLAPKREILAALAKKKPVTPTDGVKVKGGEGSSDPDADDTDADDLDDDLEDDLEDDGDSDDAESGDEAEEASPAPNRARSDADAAVAD